MCTSDRQWPEQLNLTNTIRAPGAQLVQDPVFAAHMTDNHKATEAELLQAEKNLVLVLRQQQEATAAQ